MNLFSQTLLRQRLPYLLLGIASLLPLTTLSSHAVTADTTTALSAYKVQKGDTLLGVANKFNLTSAQLASYNNKKTTDKLTIGEVLLLSSDDVAKVVSKIKPDALNYVSPKIPLEATTITYSVKSGDTINGIANRHNTTPNEILYLNNISTDSKLAIGQKIQLPVTAKTVTRENTKSAVKEKEVSKTEAKTVTTVIKPTIQPAEAKPKPTVKIIEYTVVSGDSLARLTTRYNVSLSDLIRMNPMKPTDTLKIGQKILIPVAVLNTSSDKKS